MINGLQAKVPGKDVIKFAKEHALHHREKAAYYQKNADTLAAAGFAAENASNDPKSRAMSSVKTHLQAAEELEFLINYLDSDEIYVLSQYDLQKLGRIHT